MNHLRAQWRLAQDTSHEDMTNPDQPLDIRQFEAVVADMKRRFPGITVTRRFLRGFVEVVEFTLPTGERVEFDSQGHMRQVHRSKLS